MRLLVITMLYEPDCLGIAPLASDLCVTLAERGHDVTVYTSYPYYPEWKRKSTTNPWRIQQETIAKVNVRRHGIYIPANPSRMIPRLMHEVSFPISMLRSLFDRRRYDAVIVYCPLLGSVAFAALRKLWHREPLWVNIQDIPADAAVASGIGRSRLFRAFSSIVQRFLLNRGEVWSSISPEMVARLSRIKAARTTIHNCPNWLTGSLQEQVQRVPRKIGRSPRTPLKLLYCGNIGKKQGLLELCQRLSTLDFNFQFQIRGGGGECEAVRSWVENSLDARFEFAGLLPEADFVRAIHAADWLVVPEKAGSTCSFLPSKVIPSISVGTPILAVADPAGPLGREVLEYGIGLVVPWPQLHELPSRLARFSHDPAQFTQLQVNCGERAGFYRREQAIDRMESLLLAVKQPQHRGWWRSATPASSK